jgi:ubiquinone/menaquinone biosynthesis C-methylase UbiE
MSKECFTKLKIDQYANSRNLNARASLHDRFSVNHQGLHRWEFEYLLDCAKQNILELGCGPGYLWKKDGKNAPDHWTVVLSDLSKGMIDEVRQTTDSVPASLEYVVLDAKCLPFEDERFDTVMAHHMLYHVSDFDQGVAEIYRVLEPSGYLLAATNGINHLKEVHQLVHSLSDEIIFGIRDVSESNMDAFNIENGAEGLGRSFDNIEWLEYDDQLVITQAKPLEDYILSFPGNASEVFSPLEMKKRLRRAIQAEIDREGAFYVTKATGMFVAQK